MHNIMIDIETLGNRSTSAVLSIGAVSDKPNVEPFHMYLDVQEQLDKGLTVDSSTVFWWMKQSDEARLDQSAQSRYGVHTVIAHLCAWVFENHQVNGSIDDVQMWANGAAFDFPILSNLANVFGYELPWQFWQERCYRTISALNQDIKREKTNDHNALNDALNQMQHLQRILEKVQS